MSLIKECAARFPGGQMLFDLPPSAFAALARRGMRTSLRYRVPPMPFTLSPSEIARLANTRARHPRRARSADADGARQGAQHVDVDPAAGSAPR
jgi:hypothetical protein